MVTGSSRNCHVASSDWSEESHLWRLANVSELRITGEAFERDPEFDLEGYARRSFGTFQEKPVRVVLRFDAAAVRDASTIVFHPEQSVETNADGSVTVQFEAGGIDEMCWHLFTWGDSVTIEEPARLRRPSPRCALPSPPTTGRRETRHCRIRIQCGPLRMEPIRRRYSKMSGKIKMVRVKQQDGNGCGLACIAMLARRRYATVVNKAMEIKGELREGFGVRRDFRTWTSDLRRLSEEFEFCLGRKVQFREQNTRGIEKFTSYMKDLNLGCNAVLAINRWKNGDWHWVVWDHEKGCIRDPMNGQYARRDPYRRIRPWYYLKVREAE